MSSRAWHGTVVVCSWCVAAPALPVWLEEPRVLPSDAYACPCKRVWAEMSPATAAKPAGLHRHERAKNLQSTPAVLEEKRYRPRANSLSLSLTHSLILCLSHSLSLSLMCRRDKACKAHNVVELQHDALVVREERISRFVHATEVLRPGGAEVPCAFPRSVEDVVDSWDPSSHLWLICGFHVPACSSSMSKKWG